MLQPDGVRPPTLIAGAGVLEWGKSAPGIFFVRFDRDVSRCAAVATPSSHGGGGTPGYRSIGTAHTADGDYVNVRVQRFIASRGDFVDEDASFDLVVVC